MDLTEDLENIIRPVVNSFDCELWGIDFRPFNQSALLRVYIDKVDGITLDDCSKISRQLSSVMDVEDPIEVPYTMEVSSPGLERQLLTPAHFLQYIGEKAKMRLKWPVDGQRNFVGLIEKVEGNTIHLSVEDKVIEVPIDTVSRGRLLVDIKGSNK